MAKMDLRGKKFGRLTVLADVGRSPNRHVLWRCMCACGKEVVLPAGNLKQGTKSCGCLKSFATMRLINRKNLLGCSANKFLYEGGSIEDLDEMLR